MKHRMVDEVVMDMVNIMDEEAVDMVVMMVWWVFVIKKLAVSLGWYPGFDDVYLGDNIWWNVHQMYKWQILYIIDITNI